MSADAEQIIFEETSADAEHDTANTLEPDSEIGDENIQQVADREVGNEPEDLQGSPALVRARKEAAKYRTQLRAAESSSSSLRNQLIEHYLGESNVTIKALEAAGIELAELVNSDGRVDAEAVHGAAETARAELGIPNNRFQGSADQGRTPLPHAPTGPSWSSLLNAGGK